MGLCLFFFQNTGKNGNLWILIMILCVIGMVPTRVYMYGPPWDGVSWADLSFNMFEISFATDNALVLINEDALRRPRLIRGCRVNPIGAEPAQLTIGFPPQ